MHLKYLFIPAIALSLCACETSNPKNPQRPSDENYQADDTGINVRDRDDDDDSTPTSFDQSETSADRDITQKIRQEIMKKSSLSTNAKNVKIITNNGVVTLRGPVDSDSEKREIEKAAKRVAGVSRVNNELDVAR